MGGANGDESNECSGDGQSTATLLLDGDPPSDMASEPTNVLVVSASRSVREVVEEWRRRAGTLPTALGLITYAEFDRSASAAPSGTPSRKPLSGGDITVTSMSDPTDLRRLGTAITLYLDDWVDTDRETLVYVDALDPFVDANGVEPTFQFLHLLVQSVDQSAADVVVRLDPSTTDERTINTYRTLFDRVVDDTTTRTLDDDELHALLANGRRRFVLRSLLDQRTLELDQLATQLARWENDTDEPTDTQRTRAHTALASIHLPRLAEAGIVTFDRSAERVRLADGNWSVDRLRRYLTAPLEDDG
jgi:DNA-binding transcriptional ArsR family regulator